MEIKQEDVDKLSQLDRIEFKQSYNNINDITNWGFVQTFLCLILAFSFFLYFDSFIFGSLILLGGLVLFFESLIKSGRLEKELELKYFKVNLKDKKK